MSARSTRRTPPPASKANRLLYAALVAVALPGALQLSLPHAAAPRAGLPASDEPEYLNPADLKLSPDGRKLYVVCEGNDSVLAIDLRTKRVVARTQVGHKPKGIALSPDGKSLYTSNEWSDTISEIDTGSFHVRRTLRTGWGPVGLATDRAGKVLYVANSIGDSVSLLDLSTGNEIKRLTTHRYPNHVTLSRDGRRVYVSNLLPLFAPNDELPVSEVMSIDTAKQTVAERMLIPGVIELRRIAEAPARLGGYLLVPFMRPKNLGPLIAVTQGWVLTHGMAVIHPDLGSRPEDARSKVTQVLLDDIDYYYAGAYGAAFTPDGRYALVTAAEANVVSIIDADKLARRVRRFPAQNLAERLDSARAFVVGRLPTGQNPLAIAVSPDGRFAYIANRLDDSLTVVDIPRLSVASTIDLGGPKEISQLRRGERLFHDGSFCFQGQFACATCHPADHLDGLAWNLETPQLGRDRVQNRTLRAIAETAPYKWNGHNPDLETQCGPRIAKFLFRSEGFNPQQLKDLVAFLKSIPIPPNRHLAADGQLTEAQERGRRIFFEKSCDTCHPPATRYTAKTSVDVGSAAPYDTSGLFDIPQLEGVYERAPYLHNGQALTLEEIWTKFNNNDTHGVTSDMSKEQLNDLIEFLKAL